MLGKFVLIYSLIQTFLVPVIFRSTDIPHFVSLVVCHEEIKDNLSAELRNATAKELIELIESGVLVKIDYTIEQIRVLRKRKEVVRSEMLTKTISYDLISKKYKIVANGKKEEVISFQEAKKFWNTIEISFPLEKINSGEGYCYQISARLGKIKTISHLELDLMKYWANQIPKIKSEVMKK
ncbi:hypothetical protein KKB54_02835 [bacterium]|nr:hypothetical protein [bacterium]MBU1153790.1 hypothetical protein [bacterium]